MIRNGAAASQSRILILSGPLGHGHLQTAKSIVEASQLIRSDIDVEIVDYMETTSPHLHQVGAFCYAQWVRTFPSIYGYLYKKTRHENFMVKEAKRVRGSSLRALLKLIEEKKPSVIVSTFPPAAVAVSKLKMRGLINCKTATVITDYTDHSFWLNPGTDLYLVGSERVARSLMHRGIARSTIEVTGIPVRPKFYKTYDREQLQRKYQLDPNKLTVMLMGGGWGLIPDAVLRSMQNPQWKNRVQFVVICGANERLRHRLQGIADHSEVSITVLGYVEQIHEWMACSDLMMTKPGGISTSEALMQQLPLLLYKALPGQEEDNVQELVETGMAVYAPTEAELEMQLAWMMTDPTRIRGMRAQAKSLRKHSPYHALSAILTLEETSPLSIPMYEQATLQVTPLI
ncbi:MGDG synthase family glycosyltransferase [Paenibacillus guangzhouensis]|uniref:MGDG synthase family glycosyltransferase n=1 Tax=Paenibacillus guangzhouensis TaxID=1473112 RepID=UPI0012676353|nr:glycosyltransferase [Paenibacillus guangzhouensis]